MSEPIRTAIGTMVEKLILRLDVVRPIIEAQQRTEEGLDVKLVQESKNEIHGDGNEIGNVPMAPNTNFWPRNNGEQRAGNGNESVNFPRAPWPYFDGDPLMWPTFWQQFSVNVGNKNIPDIQKCSYLLMSLKGKAERAVKGYLATGENYLLILNTLKRQFGDLKVIRESLQNELLNLPIANESVSSLRSCFEELERICRQLQNSGLHEGEDGEFMLMAVKNKFPSAIILEILKKEKESGRKWKVARWRESLNDVISLREEALRCIRSLNLSNTNSFIQRKNDDLHKGSNRFRGNGFRHNNFNRSSDVQRVFSVQENERRNLGRTGLTPKCFLCEKVHWAANCRQVVGREARLKIINEQGRCHKCLRKGHEKTNCSGKNCIICHQEHHKAICPRGQNQFRTGAIHTIGIE